MLNLFWWRWLLVANAGVFLFGLAFILLPDVMYNFFDLVLFWDGTPKISFTADTTSFLKFAYGVLGAVMIGWAISLYYILLVPFRRGEWEAWLGVTLSMTVWYVVDSIWSVATGFYENALLNTGFFVLFIIPLAATYRQFRSKVA
jgi:hypothetical protein